MLSLFSRGRSMLIRPIQPADFDAVAALTNIYIRDTAIHFATQPVSADELRASWQRTRERYPWLVAEVDQPTPAAQAGGAFAGFARAYTWRERAAYQWTPEVGVYVEPRFHRRGVGRALYAKLLDILRRQGYRSAVAGITLPSEPSVRLHEAMGFVRVGTVRDAGFKLGRWHDVGFWQVRLGEDDVQGGPILPADQCWE